MKKGEGGGCCSKVGAVATGESKAVMPKIDELIPGIVLCSWSARASRRAVVRYFLQQRFSSSGDFAGLNAKDCLRVEYTRICYISTTCCAITLY